MSLERLLFGRTNRFKEDFDIKTGAGLQAGAGLFRCPPEEFAQGYRLAGFTS